MDKRTDNMTLSTHSSGLSRRGFLVATTTLAAGALVAAPATCLASVSRYHLLSFVHTHTGEKLTMTFDVKTQKVEKTKDFFHFLRDFRTGDIHPIDTRLLDILYRLQKAANSSGTFEVISGYRSPQTNALLRKTGKSVAKKSLHMKGRAIDIRLSDVETKVLKDIAITIGKGGVGFYAKSNFIHVDTGRFRTW